MRRWILRSALAMLLAVGVVVGAVVVNGVWLAGGEVPLHGVTAHPPAPSPRPGGLVTVATLNIAKCFVHQGGASFDSAASVRRRIERIARSLRAESPDLVVLSEAITECGPADVDQVRELAEALGLHSWVFGENYNLGLPGYRVVGGNAVLSRWPLEPVSNPSLVGRQPFWVTRNNRRVLLCRLRTATGPVLIVAVHADSFSLANNERQIVQILELIGDRPALLAGDFNARPEEPTMVRIAESGRFCGEIGGVPTFPTSAPDQRIDFVLAPRSWEHVETRVLRADVSDHLPVVARFRLPVR